MLWGKKRLTSGIWNKSNEWCTDTDVLAKSKTDKNVHYRNRKWVGTSLSGVSCSHGHGGWWGSQNMWCTRSQPCSFWKPVLDYLKTNECLQGTTRSCNLTLYNINEGIASIHNEKENKQTKTPHTKPNQPNRTLENRKSKEQVVEMKVLFYEKKVQKMISNLQVWKPCV